MDLADLASYAKESIVVGERNDPIRAIGYEDEDFNVKDRGGERSSHVYSRAGSTDSCFM